MGERMRRTMPSYSTSNARNQLRAEAYLRYERRLTSGDFRFAARITHQSGILLLVRG